MPLLLAFLKDAEHDHAKDWLSSFRNEEAYGQILGYNWREEQNFCTRLAGAIGQALHSNWRKTDPPIPAIPRITPPNAFCAAETAVKVPTAALSRVMTLHCFAKFYLNRSLPMTKGLTEVELAALIEDLDPTLDMKGSLQGYYPFCWATLTDEIETAANADELRNALGTPFALFPTADDDVRREMEWLIELTYPADVPPSLHRPTVVEAQGSAEFKPSPEGSDYGTTVNLESGGEGVTEYTHPSFDARSVSASRSRGKVKTVPPTAWMAARMSNV